MCLMFGLLCLQGELWAQTVEVSGRVTADDGSTLPGVTVLEKGTSNGTTTNLDGLYELSVSGGEVVLVFSYIGYTAQEVAIGNRTVVDIVLQSVLQQL